MLPSEIENRARNVLHASPVHELRNLTIEEADGFLTVSGILPSYYCKQLAQETLRRICAEGRLALRNVTNVVTAENPAL
ncbi:MAG: BON domain-containing protein [Planctomycetia bacterium]|nr:BON domain-containing protein [Planctomycetia bacterium]